MSQSDFLIKQLSYPRVASAKNKYDTNLIQLFSKSGLNFPPEKLYLSIFKQEKTVEVWASKNKLYTLIKSYPFTATSGKPGPKVREGDLQIPEGFYTVIQFNPVSNFHLSFKINYPNIADEKRNKAETNLGGDIFIHGNNKTIGCVPLGDANMEELYWLCASAYQNNPIIPVHIFPCKMTEEKMTPLDKAFPQHVAFWKSIQPMYRYFESHKMLGEVTEVDSAGNYKLAIPCD